MERAGWPMAQLYGVSAGIVTGVIPVFQLGGDEAKFVILVGEPRGRSEFGPVPGLPAVDGGEMRRLGRQIEVVNIGRG